MDFYDGKSILITGGSSGIGLALASLLVERNCQVAILSRQAQLLENAATHLENIKRYQICSNHHHSGGCYKTG